MVILVKFFIGNCVCIGAFVCLHGSLMMILSNTLIISSHMEWLRWLLFLSIHPHYFERSWKTHPHSPTRSFFIQPSEFFTNFSYLHIGNLCVCLCFAVAFMTSRNVYFYFGIFTNENRKTLYLWKLIWKSLLYFAVCAIGNFIQETFETRSN